MIFEGTKKSIFFGLGLTRAGKTEPKMQQSRQLSELYKIPLDNIFLPRKSN